VQYPLTRNTDEGQRVIAQRSIPLVFAGNDLQVSRLSDMAKRHDEPCRE
jgi:hypothetical protein